MNMTKPNRSIPLTLLRPCVGAVLLMGVGHAMAAQQAPHARAITTAKNAAVLHELPFSNKQDFKDVRRGFIAAFPDDGKIKNAQGQVIWDLGSFQYGQGKPAPVTTNPSLWREQQLLSVGGLFKVAPHIYQVRGGGLANMTIVEGKTGIIVIDTTLTRETAQAAMALYRSQRGDRPLKAILITHSHADHFGGVLGLVTPQEVKDGKVQVIVPVDFMKEAVSENVYAGNAMGRRASYMFGNLLPKSPTGTLGAGLGLTTSAGTVTLVEPSHEISSNHDTMTIDGLKFEFMLEPETEAPSEMAIYIPKYHALTLGEDANHLMHNLYTLRGAKPRNALNWSKALNMALERWGQQTQVLFNMHTWPVWGTQNVTHMLTMQRDMYKYLNDQTLRLANEGYSMEEAAATIKLPQKLANYWSNRPYYGSVSHNVKGVWDFYLGWFDGNPAHLNPLPPAAAGKKFVQYMGGPEQVLKMARADYDKGHYRWVVQVVDKVVAANPSNAKAKSLLADAETQLGYQSENAVWRNFYLSGAKELRHGIDKHLLAPNTHSMSIMRALTVPQLLESLAIRLNGPKAAGHHLSINLDVSDVGKNVGLVLDHAVLNTVKPVKNPDLTLTLSKDNLIYLLSGKVPMAKLLKSGAVKADGELAKFKELAGLLDHFDFWWSLVLPHTAPDVK